MANGFNLYYGNDAEALLERLAERLCAPAPGVNLLVPEIILVPQFGLRRWLEIRLAERCGIIANVDFFAPAEYAWRLLRADDPQLREESLFERKLLRWRIFSELASLAEDPRFVILHGALADGRQSTRLRLAGELAQLFERYLAYRSDLLVRWEKGESRDDWQAELWRRLNQVEIEPHRARLLARYMSKYDASQRAPKKIPARLFAFACTNISPDLLHFYSVVAQHCELDFFMPNPCRQYWGDVRGERERLRELGADAFVEDENPLLAGYGRAGRDFVSQLFSYEQVQPVIEDDLSRERISPTLLQRVQNDILERLAPSARPAMGVKDTSIQFHICHSRLREVQVLHDQLVDLFQKDPSLTPRDVAVMTPDIAAYAPYVHAVFGGVARSDARHLPFTLSDCSASDAHPLIAFALKLAALPLSRMGLNELIELMAEGAVLRKLDLDSDELDQLANWLREAGVRWGIDEIQHDDFGAGRYREFSWEFGLDRLLLGYASGMDGELIDGIAPLSAVEGSSAQTLGALLRFWTTLKNLRRVQARPQSPTQWQQIYNAALNDLLAIDPQDRQAQQAIESIREALAALAEDAAKAGMNEPLDWQSVRDFLNERLSEPERSYRFFAGGISVCGMLPLRVVPFRVICLIGMNDDSFPRRDRATALARAHADAGTRGRRVDRSDRDDDRYLFLQLLTAVRDVFYLSWIGEEQRDGAKREPSAVVVELLDVVCKNYFHDPDEGSEHLLVRHPLQPFSPRQFDGLDARLFTYSEQWRKASASTIGAQALSTFVDTALDNDEASRKADAIVDLEDLQQFWRNPARAFFHDRLRLRLPRREDTSDDADPLELNGLMRYQLIDALIQTDLQAPSQPLDADGLNYWRAQALLPVGFAGSDALANALIPAHELGRALQENLGRTMPDVTQSFRVVLSGSAQLSGSLPEHHDGLICHYSASTISGSRLLRAWIELLVLATQRTDARLLLLGWDKDKKAVQRQSVALVDRPFALDQLGRLLAGYAAGQVRPLLFFPKASQTYVTRWRKSRQANGRGAVGVDNRAAIETDLLDADALEHARKIFVGGTHGGSGGIESSDAAYALAARGLDPFEPASSAAADFAQCAVDIYAPLLAALGESA